VPTSAAVPSIQEDACVAMQNWLWVHCVLALRRANCRRQARERQWDCCKHLHLQTVLKNRSMRSGRVSTPASRMMISPHTLLPHLHRPGQSRNAPFANWAVEHPTLHMTLCPPCGAAASMHRARDPKLSILKNMIRVCRSVTSAMS